MKSLARASSVIFLGACLMAQGSTETCEQWFRDSGIEEEAKTCSLDCASAAVDMATFTCPSQCQEFCSYRRKVWIFFGNGVFNTLQTARASARALQDQLRKSVERYPDLPPLIGNLNEIRIAYNVDGESFEQAAQCVEQKYRAQFKAFWEWLSDLKLAPDAFRKFFAERIIAANRKFLESDAELQDHLREYAAHHEAGDVVLVIPHSQGNFYASAAQDLLLERYGSTFAMRRIPIASPQNEPVEGRPQGEPYTTLFSDGVMNLIQNSMPPNVGNHPHGNFDHGFVEHYLNGNVSGPKILNDIPCVVSTFRDRPLTIKSITDPPFDHPSCRHLLPHPNGSDKVMGE